MSVIQIIRKFSNEFEIQVFRSENEVDKHPDSILIENIQRTALQQLERYFKRMLDDAYYEKLKNDATEIKRIRHLYEIGARR